MLEKPEIKAAKGTHLKEAIAIGLDESFTSLRESFHDLSDEQVRAFPLAGRKNIAWIVMHSLMNLDMYGPYTLRYLTYESQGDHRRWCIDWRQYGSRFSMEAEPAPGDNFPPVRQMLNYLETIQAHTVDVLDGLTSEDLLRPVRDWWECASDSCMRTIRHTMAHVRQIWLLRGALGWREGQSWPHQHWC